MKAQRRIKKLVNTFCSDLDIKLMFTPFKIKSWFGLRILSLQIDYRESFISFPVQVVVPVILVKLIDTSLHALASVNISPPKNIPTSLSTLEVLKIIAPFVFATIKRPFALRVARTLKNDTLLKGKKQKLIG